MTASDKDTQKQETVSQDERRNYSSRTAQGGSQGERQYGERQYGDRQGGDRGGEKPRTAAMEVSVDNNIEKAMKVLKRKLIKEGLFKELKSRRYYEKPSERKKRKHKESVKKVRKEEMRQKRNAMLFS